MAEMRNFEAEALAVVHGAEHWAGRLFQRHQEMTSAAQAAVTTTKGTTVMSLATDLRSLADKVEPIADEVLSDAAAVAANPATAAGLKMLSALTGVNIEPSLLSSLIADALGGVRALHTAYVGAQQAQQQAPAQQ